MKSDNPIQRNPENPEAPTAPEIPLSVIIRPNLRFDVPINVARAARLEKGCLAEVRIVAVNQETIIPAPHPFVAKLQHHNFYLTVPRLPSRILGLEPGHCVDGYIKRVG